jgi:hypothetical protein
MLSRAIDAAGRAASDPGGQRRRTGPRDSPEPNPLPPPFLESRQSAMIDYAFARNSFHHFQRNESILGADSRATIFFKTLSPLTLTLAHIDAVIKGSAHGVYLRMNKSTKPGEK